MVKLVESKIPGALKPGLLRSDSQSRTRPSGPPLYLMTSEIRGGGVVPPEAPGVQIALIACCILMLLQMRGTRAGWCLTADNRLEVGGAVRVNDNRRGEVRLEEGK